MDRSPGFGSTDCNFDALFRLAFAAAPGLVALNLAAADYSPVRSTKSTPSGLPCGLALRLLVGTRFQVLFHSPPGVLFTFPSRYSCTIGRQEYLALERGRPSFLRDFTCPTVLKVRSSPLIFFAYKAFTFFGAAFQQTSAKDVKTVRGAQPTALRPYNPSFATPVRFSTKEVWALPLSLAATEGISLISFPRGTKMFQFPRCPSYGYVFTV